MLRQKIFFLLLFTMLFGFHSFSQKVKVHVFIENYKSPPGSDTIYYDFNRRLNWSDFQGKVPAGAKWGAMTASGFSFHSSMSIDDNNIDISVGVYAFFTKYNSWKKPEANSLYHLEHEQHHFDITRLGATKLVDEIRNAHFTQDNYKTLINKIFDRVYKEQIAMQNQYDFETKNSLDSVMQVKWNQKISDEIRNLKIKGDESITLKN